MESSEGLTTEIGSLVLDGNSGSAGATAQAQFLGAIATNVDLAVGDILTVTGFENSGEHARLDYIQLSPVV